MNRIVCLLSLIAIGCQTNVLNSGRVSIVGTEFTNSSRIALMQEVETYGRDNIWAMQSLTHSFILNGFDVVERINLPELFKETGMDQSGMTAINQDSSIADSNSYKEEINKGIGLEKLKSFGKMFNVDYMGFFGYRFGQQIYLRIVSCETGKVVGLVTFEGDASISINRQETADIVVNELLKAMEHTKRNKIGRGYYGFRVVQSGFPQPDAYQFISADTIQNLRLDSYYKRVVVLYPSNPF